MKAMKRKERLILRIDDWNRNLKTKTGYNKPGSNKKG